jgi:predicted dithiol-disulfide oxidoreductase (DUF899 family)
MRYRETAQRLNHYRQQIAGLRKEMRELQHGVEPEEVKDYAFATAEGTVRLSQLFGGKENLFVVHNMGAGCPYCTLWADGFNGALPHLENRAAFVLSTPDAPETQQKFKASRGWRFPMVSHQGTSFAADMGYRGENGWLPGVSVFGRRGDTLLRLSDTGFGPGDDFCAVWHFLDLLPAGSGDWRPRFHYQA